MVGEPSTVFAGPSGLSWGNMHIPSPNDAPDINNTERYVLTSRVEAYFARMNKRHQTSGLPEGYVSLEDANQHFSQELKKNYARKRNTLDD